MLRAEDHPGDREVRDIVSIFAMTRSARPRTRKRREKKRKEKNEGGKNKAISERKHVKSIVNRLRLCPREFYDFLLRGKATTARNILREKRPRKIWPEERERKRKKRKRERKEGGRRMYVCECIGEIGKSKWLALKLPRVKCYDTVCPS